VDFSGLVKNYPLNRPLTDQERQHHLLQTKRLEVEPLDQLAVIKMNSTYLETVDKWFGWKGFVTTISLAILVIFTLPLGYMTGNSLLTAAGVLPTEDSRLEFLGFGLLMGAVLAAIWFFMVRLLKKESFRFTHYPIRYNRRTRMVHYFRTDGTTGSVPWDEVYFTLGFEGQMCGVRGHILTKDRQTVVDTFALSHTGVIHSHELDPVTQQYARSDFVRSHWEFVRRYMEEGPKEAAERVKFCMPVDGRRETAKGGAQRVFANFAGWPVAIVLMSPFCALISLARVFAMRTSEIPQWPQEIEDACEVEANDPYAIAGDSAGDKVPMHQGAR
jgi:hypothetical protein